MNTASSFSPQSAPRVLNGVVFRRYGSKKVNALEYFPTEINFWEIIIVIE